MIEFNNKQIESLIDRGESVSLEDMRFIECTFTNCALSLTKKIGCRAKIKNVDFKNCIVNGCDIGPAIIEDTVVSGLKTNDLFILWGAVFKQVKFSGSMGKIKINHYVHHSDRTTETQEPFNAHRIAFYRDIDWALDISEARFKEFDVRGIPAKLIKRDPESQVVITRERALRDGWQKELSPDSELWEFMIRLFLSDGEADTVFVVPLDAPKKKRDMLLRGVSELRLLCIAEPD